MISDMDKKIIELLNCGLSLDEMLKETNLCHSQLAQKLNKLKNNGYLVSRELVENGLKYSLNKGNFVNNDVEINVPKGYFKFLVISDTHICSANERIDLLNNLYNYALEKKFNHIFHLGDLIDNPHEDDIDYSREITTLEQVKYLIKKYPKSSSIATTILLGNHDYRSVYKEGLDITSIIETKRLDIKILGYKTAMIKLNNRYIALSHPFNFKNQVMEIPDDILDKYPNINPDIFLIGHFHKSGVYQKENNIIVNVPQFLNNAPIVSGFECILSSKNNDKIFDTFIIKPLIIEPQILPLTEIKYDLPKILEKNLNQTEKFNQRYKR